MTIQELYEFYDRKDVTICRELKIGSTTLRNWRKQGFIPIKAQMIIEKKTNGRFKARFEDAKI